MKQDIKERWISALRSGDYPQTKGTLRDADGYCCLGVLCDIAAKDGVIEWTKLNNNKYAIDDREWGALSYSVMEWAGLDERDPVIKSQLASDLNDVFGLNFMQIADVIESDKDI